MTTKEAAALRRQQWLDDSDQTIRVQVADRLREKLKPQTPEIQVFRTNKIGKKPKAEGVLGSSTTTVGGGASASAAPASSSTTSTTKHKSEERTKEQQDEDARGKAHYQTYRVPRSPEPEQKREIWNALSLTEGPATLEGALLASADAVAFAEVEKERLRRKEEEMRLVFAQLHEEEAEDGNINISAQQTDQPKSHDPEVDTGVKAVRFGEQGGGAEDQEENEHQINALTGSCKMKSPSDFSKNKTTSKHGSHADRVVPFDRSEETQNLHSAARVDHLDDEQQEQHGAVGLQPQSTTAKSFFPHYHRVKNQPQLQSLLRQKESATKRFGSDDRISWCTRGKAKRVLPARESQLASETVARKLREKKAKERALRRDKEEMLMSGMSYYDYSIMSMADARFEQHLQSMMSSDCGFVPSELMYNNNNYSPNCSSDGGYSPKNFLGGGGGGRSGPDPMNTNFDADGGPGNRRRKRKNTLALALGGDEVAALAGGELVHQQKTPAGGKTPKAAGANQNHSALSSPKSNFSWRLADSRSVATPAAGGGKSGLLKKASSSTTGVTKQGTTTQNKGVKMGTTTVGGHVTKEEASAALLPQIQPSKANTTTTNNTNDLNYDVDMSPTTARSDFSQARGTTTNKSGRNTAVHFDEESMQLTTGRTMSEVDSLSPASTTSENKKRNKNKLAMNLVLPHERVLDSKSRRNQVLEQIEEAGQLFRRRLVEISKEMVEAEQQQELQQMAKTAGAVAWRNSNTNHVHPQNYTVLDNKNQTSWLKTSEKRAAVVRGLEVALDKGKHDEMKERLQSEQEERLLTLPYVLQICLGLERCKLVMLHLHTTQVCIA